VVFEHQSDLLRDGAAEVFLDGDLGLGVQLAVGALGLDDEVAAFSFAHVPRLAAAAVLGEPVAIGSCFGAAVHRIGDFGPGLIDSIGVGDSGLHTGIDHLGAVGDAAIQQRKRRKGEGQSRETKLDVVHDPLFRRKRARGFRGGAIKKAREMGLSWSIDP
jgi:hypothetical protein